MSKMKNKYFDEINKGMEKAKLERVLSTLSIDDVSPIFIINEIIKSNSLRLTNQEITQVVRNYYKF